MDGRAVLIARRVSVTGVDLCDSHWLKLSFSALAATAIMYNNIGKEFTTTFFVHNFYIIHSFRRLCRLAKPPSTVYNLCACLITIDTNEANR